MNTEARSHGLWAATAPPAPVTQALDRDLDADVVVVGAGFTGCSAALHLAQRGARAIVLEQHEIGFGGSGRNVGLVNAGMWVMPDELPRVLGDTYGERLLAQLGNAPSTVFDLIDRFAIQCDATRSGTLHCAVGRSGLQEITAARLCARLGEGCNRPRRFGVHRLCSVASGRSCGTVANRHSGRQRNCRYRAPDRRCLFDSCGRGNRARAGQTALLPDGDRAAERQRSSIDSSGLAGSVGHEADPFFVSFRSCGRDLARLALGEIALDDLALPITDLSPARLRFAREAFYEVGAQVAHFAASRL